MKRFLPHQFSGCFSQYLLGVAWESIVDLQYLRGGCTLGPCLLCAHRLEKVMVCMLLSKETQENKSLL